MKTNHKDLTDKLYPVKKAKEMSDEEFSRWWAFMKALNILSDHAKRYNIDIDDINLNNKKIVDEYINPISGDVLYHMNKSKTNNETYTGPNIKS